MHHPHFPSWVSVSASSPFLSFFFFFFFFLSFLGLGFLEFPLGIGFFLVFALLLFLLLSFDFRVQ
jgi:hypothetical protein